jgi:putative DNA primase/helicase
LSSCPNDDAGRKHADKKAAVACEAGAASIKIVHFPELPPKGDVSDFIASGGSGEQLAARIEATAGWSLPLASSQSQAESPSRQD